MDHAITVDVLELFEGLDIFRVLGPRPLAVLARQASLCSLTAGETLFSEGDTADAMFVVVEGDLVVTALHGDVTFLVGRVGPGDPIGEMQVLAGGNRTATVIAETPCRLVRIPNAALRTLSESFPALSTLLNNTIIQRLRSNQLVFTLLGIFGELTPEQLADFESMGQWLRVARGEVLFRQGQEDDNLYLIISGRFQVSCVENSGEERPVAEVGRGETIGEMSMLSREPRSATVMAIRDSEVVRFSAEDFTCLLNRYPRGFFNLTNRVIDRLRHTLRPPTASHGAANIVLIPADPAVPIEDLTARLTDVLKKHGPSLRLDAETLDRMLRYPASCTGSQDPFDLALSAWLDEQERTYRFILLQTGWSDSPWRRRCMKRADRILIVADRPPGPEVLDLLVPKVHEPCASMAGRLLVWLRKDQGVLPLPAGSGIRSMPMEQCIQVREGSRSDLERLARLLADKSVGLVLSGGGARALAQIGVIEAIEGAGLPVDLVGGCSMGAVIGAMHCMGWTAGEMTDACREAFARKNPLSDYTVPRRALIKGRLLEAYLREAFEETHIEELHKTFFCVSSSLATARPVIHTRGLLWRALRASLSLPGILPPVEMDGMLLVDGGMLNNLPVDIMKKAGGGFVVAVDVTQPNPSIIQTDTPSVQSSVSPGSPLRQPEAAPGIIDVIMRSLCLGGARSVRENRVLADVYIKLPLGDFGFLDFEALDKMVALGRAQAEPVLSRIASIVV